LPFGFLKLLTGKRKIHRIRVMTLGVVPEFRNMGIETVFLREVYRKSMARGYIGGEFSWILEDNEAINGSSGGSSRSRTRCTGSTGRRYEHRRKTRIAPPAIAMPASTSTP